MIKLTALLLSFIAIFTVSARPLTPTQRAMVQQRTRVIARDTQSIPGHVVTTLRKGSTTWQVTNKLAVVNVSIAPRKISKLKLIVNLKAADKWITVKQFISDYDLTDEWQACQWIQTDYPLFISATNTAVRAGMATDAEIQRLIKKSYDD